MKMLTNLGEWGTSQVHASIFRKTERTQPPATLETMSENLAPSLSSFLEPKAATQMALWLQAPPTLECAPVGRMPQLPHHSTPCWWTQGCLLPTTLLDVQELHAGLLAPPGIMSTLALLSMCWSQMKQMHTAEPLVWCGASASCRALPMHYG